MARPKRKTTIGDNPLDILVPRASQTSAAVAEPEEAPRPAKERMTFHLPVEVMERAKNASYWTPGLTLTGPGRPGPHGRRGPSREEAGGAIPSQGSGPQGREADEVMEAVVAVAGIGLCWLVAMCVTPWPTRRRTTPGGQPGTAGLFLPERLPSISLFDSSSGHG